MARIELAPEVLDDFDRFFDHLTTFEIDDAPERIAQIVLGLQVLTHSPLIGCKLRGSLRELMIGKGTRGYLALYRYAPNLDTVFVLAIRSQPALGWRPEA